MSRAPPCALVTGASSGIGRLAAQALARRGLRVFGTSRSPRPDEGEVHMLQLDVTSADSVQRCLGEVAARAGEVEVLVNNAGVEHLGIVEETTEAEARAVFETNLFGPARMCAAVLPQMRARGRGRIVNVGSLAAWLGEPGEAFYAASKAALARYTEALRYEVGPLGVQVCLVEPGAFRTGILGAAGASKARIPEYDRIREAARATLERGASEGGDPAAAAARIVEAATARSPRRRYAAGADAAWVPLIKTLLPQRLFDALLMRGFGLD